MTTFLRDFLTVNDVQDGHSLLEFYQQTVGGSKPNSPRQIIRFRGSLREFFQDNPQADWGTLARTVTYMRVNKIRAYPWNIPHCVPGAWKAGYLPELDPVELCDPNLEGCIADALDEESDVEWRRRLIGAQGVKARRQVYTAWRQGKRDPLA
jgi:hypothetical protein